MKRLIIFGTIIVALFLILVMIELRSLLFLFLATLALLGLVIYDFFQKDHAILRNFPGLGHLRFLLEMIRPEIRQYFIASDAEERPFPREMRNVVYRRAKKTLDTVPFGTQHDIAVQGYELARHSLKPTHLPKEQARILVGNSQCRQPYLASRLNISAMSYGALSKNAIMALNKGAQLGNFAHNTGEGGLSPYHLQGGDIVWQLGTANFGARKPDGMLDEKLFTQKANLEVVKMIEVKLSQGAKPSHGGILPAAKITPEIAEIRSVELGKDCLSPPTNPEFSTPKELLHFIQKLRDLSNGKPVGFKLAIGIRSEFLSICKAMLETGIVPDFITVDGAEGGTGAAPLEFANRLGEPLDDALVFVHNALTGVGLRDQICVIASGKVTTGFDMVSKLALGADMCNAARAMMFALGCIQAMQCNRNTCPTGVTTQNPRLMRGLDVNNKSVRVANFQQATINSFLELAGAMGINHIDDINQWHVFQRDEHNRIKSYAEMYEFIQANSLLSPTLPASYARDWQLANSESF